MARTARFAKNAAEAKTNNPGDSAAQAALKADVSAALMNQVSESPEMPIAMITRSPRRLPGWRALANSSSSAIVPEGGHKLAADSANPFRRKGPSFHGFGTWIDLGLVAERHDVHVAADWQEIGDLAELRQGYAFVA